MRTVLCFILLAGLTSAGCLGDVPWLNGQPGDNVQKPDKKQGIKPQRKQAPEPVKPEQISLDNAREFSEKLEHELDYAQQAQSNVSWKKTKLPQKSGE